MKDSQKNKKTKHKGAVGFDGIANCNVGRRFDSGRIHQRKEVIMYYRHIIPVIQVKVMPGTMLEEAIEEAIHLAKERHCIVSFKFNGIEIEVDEYKDDTDIEILTKIYKKKIKEVKS